MCALETEVSDRANAEGHSVEAHGVEGQPINGVKTACLTTHDGNKRRGLLVNLSGTVATPRIVLCHATIRARFGWR